LIMRSLRRSSCCYWSAVDCDGRATWSRLMALLLERLLWVLALHSGSLDGACSSVKPDEARELIWLVPLKSSPTCSYLWLHCDLQNVPHKHPNCTVRTQLANWSARLANWTSYIVSGWCRNSPWRVTWLLAVSVLAWLVTCKSRDYHGRISPASSHVRGRCVMCSPAVA
jgi:hypothetical protein